MSILLAFIAFSMQSYAVYPTPVQFKSACDLHSPVASNISDETLISRGSLPQKAHADWLHASESDIMEWYKKGKAECEAFLVSNISSLGTNFPPPYQEKNNIKWDEQTKCRGRDMLHSLTGALIWPFGPSDACSTYSRCWFGLLTCGEPNMESLAGLGRSTILESLHHSQPQAVIPPISDWSIRALVIHLRIIGLEIIVPEQRYVSIATGIPQMNVDVIIAQYVITLPYENYKLEMRHVELYPSALYQWTLQDIDLHGMETAGNIYLGGSETRCSAGICRHGSTCCGCDERSYISGTPITINAKSGIEQCPNVLNLRESFEKQHKKNSERAEGVEVKMDEPSHLPLCSAGDNSLLGRWIMSSYSRRQYLSASAPSCPLNSTSTAFNQVPKGSTAAHDDSSKTSHRHHTGSWFEASGDPCIVQNGEAEEMGEKSWFFAPYQCRYHFYKKSELQHCMNVQNISHIHFHGDSMSRDLFVYVANYLGVPTVTEAEMKHLTNDMNQKKTFVHSDGILLSEGTVQMNGMSSMLVTVPVYDSTYFRDLWTMMLLLIFLLCTLTNVSNELKCITQNDHELF